MTKKYLLILFKLSFFRRWMSVFKSLTSSTGITNIKNLQYLLETFSKMTSSFHFPKKIKQLSIFFFNNFSLIWAGGCFGSQPPQPSCPLFKQLLRRLFLPFSLLLFSVPAFSSVIKATDLRMNPGSFVSGSIFNENTQSDVTNTSTGTLRCAIGVTGKGRPINCTTNVCTKMLTTTNTLPDISAFDSHLCADPNLYHPKIEDIGTNPWSNTCPSPYTIDVDLGTPGHANTYIRAMSYRYAGYWIKNYTPKCWAGLDNSECPENKPVDDHKILMVDLPAAPTAAQIKSHCCSNAIGGPGNPRFESFTDDPSGFSSSRYEQPITNTLAASCGVELHTELNCGGGDFCTYCRGTPQYNTWKTAEPCMCEPAGTICGSGQCQRCSGTPTYQCENRSSDTRCAGSCKKCLNGACVDLADGDSCGTCSTCSGGVCGGISTTNKGSCGTCGTCSAGTCNDPGTPTCTGVCETLSSDGCSCVTDTSCTTPCTDVCKHRVNGVCVNKCSSGQNCCSGTCTTQSCDCLNIFCASCQFCFEGRCRYCYEFEGWLCCNGSCYHGDSCVGVSENPCQGTPNGTSCGTGQVCCNGSCVTGSCACSCTSWSNTWTPTAPACGDQSRSCITSSSSNCTIPDETRSSGRSCGDCKKCSGNSCVSDTSKNNTSCGTCGTCSNGTCNEPTSCSCTPNACQTCNSQNELVNKTEGTACGTCGTCNASGTCDDPGIPTCTECTYTDPDDSCRCKSGCALSTQKCCGTTCQTPKTDDSCEAERGSNYKASSDECSCVLKTCSCGTWSGWTPDDAPQCGSITQERTRTCTPSNCDDTSETRPLNGGSCSGCETCVGNSCVSSCSPPQTCCQGQCKSCSAGYTLNPQTCNCDPINLCEGVNCLSCQKCENGSCVADNTASCGTCKKCSGGSCVNDNTASCGTCKKCSGGSCVNDNTASCGTCKKCSGGSCVANNTASCGTCKKCSGGSCVNDNTASCGTCKKCSGGSCVNDNTASCGTCKKCSGGSCVNDNTASCGTCKKCSGGSCVNDNTASCGTCGTCSGGSCTDDSHCCGSDRCTNTETCCNPGTGDACYSNCTQGQTRNSSCQCEGGETTTTVFCNGDCINSMAPVSYYNCTCSAGWSAVCQGFGSYQGYPAPATGWNIGGGQVRGNCEDGEARSLPRCYKDGTFQVCK